MIIKTLIAIVLVYLGFMVHHLAVIYMKPESYDKLYTAKRRKIHDK